MYMYLLKQFKAEPKTRKQEQNKKNFMAKNKIKKKIDPDRGKVDHPTKFKKDIGLKF